MTQLALLLTIVFMLFSLRRDILEDPHFAPASWISFIWIGLSASRSINYWVYPSQAVAFNQRIAWEQQNIDLVQNNPLERNLMIGLIILGLIALSRRRGRSLIKFEDNSWITFFYLFTLFSISWSDYQGVAIKRWIRFIGDVVAILIILTDLDPEKTMDRIFRRMAIILLPLSVLFIRYYGELGRIYTTYGTQMWVGVTGHKNQLGMLCAYSGIFLVWRGLKKWPKLDFLDAFLLALACYLLIGSKSQTSMIVFLLGILILVSQSRMKGDLTKINRIIVMVLVGLFIIQALAIVFLDKSLAPAFFSAAGRDASFTGRVPLWQELLGMGGRSPFFGTGFSSFWLDSGRVMEVWHRVGWTPTTAHNGYLDAFLDLGLSGLIILFFLMVQTFRSILRTLGSNRELGKLKIVLFVMIIFHNFTETSLGKPNSLLWLLFLFASIFVIPNAGRASQSASPGDTRASPVLPEPSNSHL